MIKVENLTKTFNRQEAVNNISFTLEPRTCTALLGPNGAGKTTTLRMMAGLIHQTHGSIQLSEKPVKDIRQQIGYLPQHPQFHSWMSGREFLVYVGRLAFLSKKEAAARADQLLERVGISDAGRKRIGKYSGGMKQRLGIAQAMIHKPKLLMLDEPVSALDPIGRRDVLNLMEELKEETTLLFSTHILNDAEEASDHLLLMNHGKIIESGSFAEVRQRHALNKVVLKLDDSLTSISDLQNLPYVDRVEEKNKEIHIYMEDMKLGRKKLIQYFSEHDLPVQYFEAGSMSLEELFMKVVSQDAMADRV
ncbi:ABC transporter ATP-binding protein [Halobacillus sp. Marseille-Q1614]|uniref:ABC transporter ATP-binding protein n=1 Tax=Halobacillus sp. Marseille-Q1614 TaxID=2709134 RepID=UPI00156EA97B|nr:ABC transporter ATP-binding protein [Halobacillus sp. Marseille-Q1614]